MFHQSGLKFFCFSRVENVPADSDLWEIIRKKANERTYNKKEKDVQLQHSKTTG